MSADPTHFAQAYWDTAAETYVQDFSGTGIGETRRHAVWRRLDKIFSPGQKLLELNCGTGIDAVHLAERGIQLVACDISSRMIELALQLSASTDTSELIDFRVLPNEEIGSLKGENVFDGAFSNFCGLNCVEDLPAVVRELTKVHEEVLRGTADEVRLALGDRARGEFTLVISGRDRPPGA